MLDNAHDVASSFILWALKEVAKGSYREFKVFVEWNSHKKRENKMLVRNPILTSATNMGTLLGRKGKNNPQKYGLKVQWNIWFWVRLWGQQSKPGHGGYEKNFHCCKVKHLSEKMWPLLHCWTIQPRFSGHPGHSPWTATLNFTVEGWCQYKTLWLV